MKTVFFGTSHYSAQFLELILKANFKVDLVISAPPKPVGRKQILTDSPTVVVAQKYNLPFILSLKELASQENLKIGLILDYNRIIPQSIIDLFPQGIINIHFSKLPQYRGPAPVQQTILDGQENAWITYYLITAGLDEGPILSQTSLPLSGNETTASLYETLITKAAGEISQIVRDYLEGKITLQSQPGEPSFTEKLTVEKTKIDWRKAPEELDRLIRAASPEPGAWTEVKLSTKQESPPKRLKILKAHLENSNLILDQVQLEGKNPVSLKQFKEGYPEMEIIKQ
ncbi:MAG: methionyl-tRNA formyltransferase [Patescibacteria group bacterium]|jgi:methionyl-tRNA formyltransferase